MNPISAQLLGTTIDLIYEAVLDDELWTEAFYRISSLFRASTIALTIRMESIAESSRVVIGCDPYWQMQYDKYYHTVNPFTKMGIPTSRPGQAVISQELISDSKLMACEYYNEFLKPQDIFHMIAAVVDLQADCQSLLAAFRPQRREAFSPSDRGAYERFLPHLRRAARLRRNLSFKQGVIDGAESLPIGVLVLDSAGKIVYANTCTRQLLKSGDALYVDTLGRVTTTKKRLLKDLLLKRTSLRPGDDLIVERPLGRLPLKLLVCPSSWCGPFNHGLTSFLISDPEIARGFDSRLLSLAYDLTPRECTVASLLAKGLDIKAICEILRLRQSTVRSHLKSLMQKLGVHRQSDLLSILLRFQTVQMSGN